VTAPVATDATRLVDEAREVRGVVAAAVVTVDGEVVAAAGEGAALLERMQRTVTSALAAGEAFSSLLDALRGPAEGAAAEGEADEAAASGEAPPAAPDPAESHLTVLYQDVQPLLVEPLPGGDRLLVVAVGSAGDIGRARFHLRQLRARRTARG